MRKCDKIGLIALVAATSLGGNVFSAAANGADAPQLSLRNWRAPVQAAREAVPGFVWLEAEGFRDYGKWHLDTQFVHKMGSAYLLAAAARARGTHGRARRTGCPRIRPESSRSR